MDLQFLSGAEDNESLEKGQSILRNIIHMTQELHLQTVVEGVETKSQKDFICDIGDCVAQGFYYSKPISTNEFKSLLADAHNLGMKIIIDMVLNHSSKQQLKTHRKK